MPEKGLNGENVAGNIDGFRCERAPKVMGGDAFDSSRYGKAPNDDQNALIRKPAKDESAVFLYPIGQRRPRRPLTRTAIGC
jgi:hypothetical protein